MSDEPSFDERAAAVERAESVDVDHGPVEDLPCLPEAFWSARPSLLHIRHAAWSAGRSGDVALFGVMTRVSALVSHELRFDAGVGRGSLNLYAGIVGQSGAGKSSGAQIAEDLVGIPPALRHEQPWLPSPFLSIGMGTGEGLIEAYYGEVVMETGELDKGKPVKAKVRKQVRHNVFCYVDEGAQIVKQMERPGSVAGAIIRTMWNGESAGQQNADSTRTRYITRGSYSLGLLIGFQQSTALPFLSGMESNMGTPQRFLWGAIYDPALPDEEHLPVHPGELKIELMEEWTPSGHRVRDLRSGTIDFPEPVKKQMRVDQIMRTRGLDRDADPLDAHEPLMRCKVASILAIIDGRFTVNDDDWQLARIVWETSCAIRDGLVEYARSNAAAEDEARTAAHISRHLRTKEAERGEESQRNERIAKHLTRLVRAEEGSTRGAIRRDLAGRDKPYFDEALAFAVDMNWVETNENSHLIAGKSMPA